MGPGYFPLMLGILLAILGGFIIFEALVVETEDGDKIGKWAWKPLGFIIGANLLFGILLAGLPSIGIPALGLIIAIYALTIISAWPARVQGQVLVLLATVLAILQLLRLHLGCSSCRSRSGRRSSPAEAGKTTWI
jgi:hypothetical protein